MTQPQSKINLSVQTENEETTGPFLFVCEHASHHIPEHLNSLGLDETARTAHIAWDPGAYGVARGLANLLNSPLISAQQSRLIYDLNRPPDAATAMAEASEAFDIPGNADLSQKERLRRTNEIYLPFHNEVRRLIAHRLAAGIQTILVTLHSFTPIYLGKPRTTELGIIHDTDATYANTLYNEAKAKLSLVTELNEPYDASDGVTHTLRLHAIPYGLQNAMLEIRNDLIRTEEDQSDMARKLAPILKSALNVTDKELTAAKG